MTTVQVRNLSDSAHERLKRGAQARGWTMAEYIEALLALHEDMLTTRITDDVRDELVLLAEHGLGPVRF